MRTAIHALSEAAQTERVAIGLGADGQAVWEALCDEAAHVVLALFVCSKDRRINWGLRSLGMGVTEATLLMEYWWMLLYLLVMLRNRGIEGFTADKAIPELRHAARRFAARSAPAFGLASGELRAWQEGWESQVALEASLGIYDRTMELLDLPVDVMERIDRVSLFTTATEQSYDSSVRIILRRRGAGTHSRR